MKHTVHFFDSSKEAYDACQCDGLIQKGDIFVVESESIVGICQTWPFAITSNSGSVHELAFGWTAKEVAEQEKYPDHSEFAEHLAAVFLFPRRED